MVFLKFLCDLFGTTEEVEGRVLGFFWQLLFKGPGYGVDLGPSFGVTGQRFEDSDTIDACGELTASSGVGQ